MNVSLALLSGAALGFAVFAAFGLDSRGAAARWLARQGAPGRTANPGLLARLDSSAPVSLATALERAGWRDGPGRFVAGLVLASAAMAASASLVAVLLIPAAAPATAIVAAAAPPLLAYRAIRSAAARRRERLAAELAAILELLAVELTAGTPLVPALETVLGLTEGQLAVEMQAQLIGSRVAGSAPLDERLNRLAGRHGLPALEAFATVLALSREFGMAVTPGVRTLAADLVRERRNQVIASSRRALKRVLIPAAVGVLLPFMSILLFPALVTLLGSLR